jgi:formamidopyrimidine-DNA glycosylase
VPELPEVETVRRTLAPAIGRRVAGVWISGLPLRLRRPVDRAALVRAAVGARLADVRRLGKYLLLDFEDRDESILVHLGMSGRLRVVARDEPRAPHTHVVLDLEGPDQLRFSDPRRFGMVEVAPAGAASRRHPALTSLGVDPIAETVDVAAFHASAARSRQSLKALLLDQTLLAGVGNIYASEALWRARIKPTRRGVKLTRSDAGALARAVLASLRAALDKGGTSLKDRAGERCLRRGCAGRIRRTVQQGRATFHCPVCQPR